jgi:hypothetical protein
MEVVAYVLDGTEKLYLFPYLPLHGINKNLKLNILVLRRQPKTLPDFRFN